MKRFAIGFIHLLVFTFGIILATESEANQGPMLKCMEPYIARINSAAVQVRGTNSCEKPIILTIYTGKYSTLTNCYTGNECSVGVKWKLRPQYERRFCMKFAYPLLSKQECYPATSMRAQKAKRFENGEHCTRGMKLVRNRGNKNFYDITGRNTCKKSVVVFALFGNNQHVKGFCQPNSNCFVRLSADEAGTLTGHCTEIVVGPRVGGICLKRDQPSSSSSPARQTQEEVNPAALEAALRLSRRDRQDVQRSLAILGYSTGGIDGIFGRMTRIALSKWQVKAGLSATGYLAKESLQALRSESNRADAARSGTDRTGIQPAPTTSSPSVKSSAERAKVDDDGCQLDIQGKIVPEQSFNCDLKALRKKIF